MKTKIIQWNINGFFSRLEELQILTKELNPTIVCINASKKPILTLKTIPHSSTTTSINAVASLEPVAESQ